MIEEPISAVERAASEFRRDVLEGLAASPKAIPGKYLWDERGSQIFEEITRFAGYYPTYTETSLLGERASEIADLVGRDAAVVEFGSGATHKVALLLDVLETPRRYIGIDISSEFTAAAAARLRAAYPAVEVAYVEADYSRELPALPVDRARPVFGFLLGCAICNMEPVEAVGLLARVRRGLGDSLLLVGQDTTQNASRLQLAYGNTPMAAFHENLLARLRHELGASLSPEHFRHEARILDAPRRAEAHLVAIEPTKISIDDRTFSFAAGESMRTDMSIKYAPDAFAALAAEAGWAAVRRWSDPQGLYCVHLLRSG